MLTVLLFFASNAIYPTTIMPGPEDHFSSKSVDLRCRCSAHFHACRQYEQLRFDIRTGPIWNSKCLLVIASRNLKVFPLREKTVRNLRTTLLITLKAEELGSFLTSLAFRSGPVCALIRNGLLSTKFLRQL